MATESDHKLAKESATLAGQLLLLLRDAAKGTQITPETLGKIADKKSHELLYKIISDVSPMMRYFQRNKRTISKGSVQIVSGL